MAAATRVDGSAWAPLRLPLFRAFWLASLASNFGTWIHEIGAGWLMTSLTTSPEMVSYVRTSMALPIVVLAIPAGVFADRVDRRRLLLVTQLVMFATTATLASLTLAGAITPWFLLSLTFVIGLGMVLHVPTWQASMPELVPRPQLSRAVALGSISFNLARALGPATGGVLIATFGVWSAFAANAISFLGVIFVLTRWRRTQTESSRGQTFRKSLTQGLWYVLHKRTMRHVLLGVALFVGPASVLWALVPLVTRERLGWGPDGFGVLVGTIGVGAVIAAANLSRVQRRLGSDGAVAVSMWAYAVGLAILATFTSVVPVILATLVMGGGWMMALTTLNATAQVTLPRQLRARGMGCYLTAMATSMAVGSLIWGRVAAMTDLPTALGIASGTLVVTGATSLRFRFERSLHDGGRPSKRVADPRPVRPRVTSGPGSRLRQTTASRTRRI